MAVTDRTAANGTTPHSGEISVRNPVTGSEIGRIRVTPRDEVKAAVERARKAQVTWRATTIDARARLLRRFGDLLWENQRSIMDTIRAETGKNDTGAFIEVAVLDSVITWCVNNAPTILAPKHRRPAFPVLQMAKVYYKPHGVAGFITPWNYPMMLSYVDAVPALIAGNAVVIKPSELTPYSAVQIADLMAQAGMPANIVQVLTGDGSTGAALVDEVDYISFTGSTETGRKVAMRAAERLIPFSMELGGKDAMIVLKDADLDMAAASVLTGALENCGQMCISVERVYVEAPVYDEFVQKVRDYAAQLVIGSGSGFDVHIGSMTNARELERVELHVADAVEKGAELVFGGKRRLDIGPLFYEPAILANANHSMEVMREETFGPVVPIMRVKDAEEAVRLANDNRYGLSGTIFTRNLEKGEHLATHLNTGDVGINRTSAVAASADLPWGGQKDSGSGRRGGKEGLLRFVAPQSIVVDRQIGTTPSLTLLDPLTMTGLQIVRVLRRYIPFI